MSDSKINPVDGILQKDLNQSNSIVHMFVESEKDLPDVIEKYKQNLIQRALDVQKKAYCLYSDFYVGASLLVGRIDPTTNQVFLSIVDGCNIENQSYGATICAERSAVCTMVPRGYQEIFALAVATKGGVAPCGICRQVLSEFAKITIPVWLVDSSNNAIASMKFSDLLPRPVNTIFNIDEKKKDRLLHQQ